MRKVHLKVVLDVFVEAEDELDINDAFNNAEYLVSLSDDVISFADVQYVNLESLEITDSR